MKTIKTLTYSYTSKSIALVIYFIVCKRERNILKKIFKRIGQNYRYIQYENNFLLKAPKT